MDSFHADSTVPIPALLEEPEYRIEGALKVTGGAPYAADIHLDGALWAKFLASTVPHARIVSIDSSAALALPGVRAVVTGADIGPRRVGQRLYDRPVLAYEQVRYIGERVAAVAADTPEIAEEAVNLVHAQYEELPAVFDAEAALAADAPILHPDAASYYYEPGQRSPVPHPNVQGYRLVRKGDPEIERAFASAHRVIEDVLTADRQHQGYIEPRACVVWIDSDGTVHVHSTNKAPFGLRHQFSIVTGLPADRIVIDSMFIGGDFGGKGHSIDEFACYFLAQATGLPVKSVMTYTEELGAAAPRHGAKFYLRTAVDAEGRMLAHQSRAYYNGGAYAAGRPLVGPILDGWSTLDPYAVPHSQLETFVVYTNTVFGGQMRAPGAAHTGFVGEAHVDHIARELGMDPLEFRLLNAVRDGDSGASGERVRHPAAVRVLETLRRETAWGEKPLPPHRGRGLSLRSRDVGQGRAEVALRLLAGGQIEALHGSPDQGGGSATVVRRVAAGVLSVDPERVLVRYGTTAEAPFSPGAGGSRLTHLIGQATFLGAADLKRKLEDLAAEAMGWPEGQVRIEGDRFVVGAAASETASFDEVADRVLRGGPVEAYADYDSAEHHHPDGDAANFCAYMVEVEVDPDTGQVHPIEAVQVVDVGTIINPIAHQGQLEGGFVFGLGNALMEELVIEDGRVTTVSLGDYKLPTQEDVPPLRTILIPTTEGPGPFGGKAAGELTNNAVPPAVANAVYDATGVPMRRIPITAERVWAALHESRASGGDR